MRPYFGPAKNGALNISRLINAEELIFPEDYCICPIYTLK